MNNQEALRLGQQVAGLVQAGECHKAYHQLAPVLAERTPFTRLGRIGATIGAGQLENVNAFLRQVADHHTEGGWVVIGSALGQQLGRDFSGAFDRCQVFIIQGDVWYATDILGERVPGPALVADFPAALIQLAPWRVHPNRWVRRCAGVAGHFWAKRAHGNPLHLPQVKALLAFLEPMFEEPDPIAIRGGVGWALKTLGKFYPEIATDWLAQQLGQRKRQPRALLVGKALTYLSPEQRARVAWQKPS
jgi:hypothetical protein